MFPYSLKNVGGLTTQVAVTPTITAGAYVSGDSLGGKLAFANVVLNPAGSGILQGITVTDKAKKNNAIDFLFFTGGDPSGTTFTEHAQLTVAAADLLNCKAVSFPSSQYVSLATNSVGSLTNIGLRLKLTAGTTLYVAAVARGTIAYASVSDLTFTLAFDQDA